ncbi:RTA1 like protein-domain-containing protein [Penicillium angulare]|uniref:RTA1 like protein-domain-containing protein n=1 Tax=Penicillium angulare TaxID=116970 RepID=A0A9W9GBJ5_9EURO|nr:RTA1 like protein-domain-containing protein [Penicillium angulare]
MASDDSDSNPYYDYKPSKIVAAVFAILFILITLPHIWKTFRTRQWFGLTFVLGGLFEIFGLAARAYSSQHLTKKGIYIVQLLLILLAPIVFAAGVYMFLGRLIRASGHPKLSIIRINWLTKIFVVGDVFCFFVQAAGATMLTNADKSSTIKTAQNIILAGLGLQVAFFCLFLIAAVVFHIRISKGGLAKSVDPSLHLQAMLFSIYACGFLITVRNAYRLVEYKSGDGKGGYLQENEWPNYGLDVGLMYLVMLFSVFWYGADTKARYTAPDNLNMGAAYKLPDYDNNRPYDTPSYPTQPTGYGNVPHTEPTEYTHMAPGVNAPGTEYHGAHTWAPRQEV